MSEVTDMYKSCPKCSSDLASERCHAFDCDDGYWEDDDGVNGAESVRCDECNGTGMNIWCKECGWDDVDKRFLSPKYEEEFLAGQSVERASMAADEISETLEKIESPKPNKNK